VSKLAGILFCGALVLLAGCATAPDEPLPPDWSATNEVRTAPLPPVLIPIPPVIKTNRPPVAVVNFTNLPPATNAFTPHFAPVFTWTSLDRWAVENKIGPVRRLTGGPTTRYYLDAKNGLLVLEIGSREAIWRGLQFHLGYAPEIIDNQVFVHGLDLQKNLAPLMLGDALAFGTNRIIVIDPGHGGINGGTISVLDKRPEKEFTLDWARRIKPLLEQEGWQVFLTRTNDVDIALSNRVAMAEMLHAGLFVSLHFNSLAPDQKPVGLATFCLTPAGLPSTVTRGYPDILFQNFPNNNFDTQNMQLAERLHRALLHATSLEDRGVNRARFIGVLRGQRRPSVLIEAGFLSNPHEAKRIADPLFRQKLAEAVATALK
jgi:N-acetylmuramoyl-L-alanine amidase